MNTKVGIYEAIQDAVKEMPHTEPLLYDINIGTLLEPELQSVFDVTRLILLSSAEEVIVNGETHTIPLNEFKSLPYPVAQAILAKLDAENRPLDCVHFTETLLHDLILVGQEAAVEGQTADLPELSAATEDPVADGVGYSVVMEIPVKTGTVNLKVTYYDYFESNNPIKATLQTSPSGTGDWTDVAECVLDTTWVTTATPAVQRNFEFYGITSGTSNAAALEGFIRIKWDNHEPGQETIVDYAVAFSVVD
jgi:hypothetical protein